MRLDRRLLLGATLLAAVVLAALDALGGFAWIGELLAVPGTPDGSVLELAATVERRSARVGRLAATLDRDPLLSAALLSTGLGAGLVLGGVGAYLHQRRRLRRGDADA